MQALRKFAENFRILIFPLVLIFEAKCLYIQSVIRLCMHLACMYKPTSNVVIVVHLAVNHSRSVHVAIPVSFAANSATTLSYKFLLYSNQCRAETGRNVIVKAIFKAGFFQSGR